MRASDIRTVVLSAVAKKPLTHVGLQAANINLSNLHDEILAAQLRGMVRDGLLAKSPSGEYRLPQVMDSQEEVNMPVPEQKPLPAGKKAIERTAAGLREALFDAIDGLRSGAIDVKQANAIANAAGTILESINTQVAFEKLRKDSKVPDVLPPMKLVGDLRGS